jgi:predicted short-subunit dehydrogenase-like oxidoreductase (DUF2520 family)
MRVVIIGSGNVANVLGEKIVVAGHEVLQVFGRDEQKAGMLAGKLKAATCTDRELLSTDADLYLVAVSDAAVASIAGWLRVKDKLVVHTAGSVMMQVLKPCSSRYGVLYPLQTIRREVNMTPEIPLLVDGDSNETIAEIFSFAGSLSATVHQADDDKRKKLHVSAVIINNFSNHLYTLAADYCRTENLDFRLLLPLIAETAERIKNHSPKEVHTGPAVRNDAETIATHLHLLGRYPELSKLYQVFTESISGYYRD